MTRTTKMRAGLAALALVVAAGPALAFKPFTADYQVLFQGSPQGEGTMRLAAAGDNRWKYTLDIKGTSGVAAMTGADIAQSTTFEVVNGQWRPLQGSDSSKMLFKKRSTSAVYDWRAGEARWTGDIKPERAGPVRLRAGDVDALLLNLALARDVPAGKPLDYRLVDDGRVKQLSYKVDGQESVTVDGASRQATRVVRIDGDKQTIVWVVDGLPVPARILQRERGKDELDLRIKSLR